MKKNSRNIFTVAIALVLIFGIALVIYGCAQKGNASSSQAKVMYHCPMHPTYMSDKPGDCPICGMRLVKMETKTEGHAAASAQTTGAVKLAEEKTLEEICLEHKCTMDNCTMNIKVHIKPGERILCPTCGEVISTANGKVIEIVQQPAKAAPKRKILYYRNPMNPQATSPAPMKDSMGMDYVPVYEEGTSASTGRTIMVSSEKQQLIGVETGPVKKIALEKVIHASGKIAYDPQLVVTQEEFIQALNNEDNVKDSPLKDVIDRARALTSAARRKLNLSGMSDDQIVRLEKVRKSDSSLYLPAKGEGVWAYISIYEYEIGLVKPGMRSDIEAVAYPGEIFSGEVVSINPVLDPATRTNLVRIKIPNPDDKLKPEMFVNAKIKAYLGEKLAVPERAILDTGLRKIVYLSEEDGVLESREVKLGLKAEGYYEVLAGLEEGDIVVTSGNFLIDSESKLKSISQNAQ